MPIHMKINKTKRPGKCQTCLWHWPEVHGAGGKRCHRVLHVMQRYIVDCFTSADAVQAVYKRMGLKLDFGDPMNWIELEDNE